MSFFFEGVLTTLKVFFQILLIVLIFVCGILPAALAEIINGWYYLLYIITTPIGVGITNYLINT